MPTVITFDLSSSFHMEYGYDNFRFLVAFNVFLFLLIMGYIFLPLGISGNYFCWMASVVNFTLWCRILCIPVNVLGACLRGIISLLGTSSALLGFAFIIYLCIYLFILTQGYIH